MMEFCSKCGSRLTPKKKKTGKEQTIVLVCPKCGYKKQTLNSKVALKPAKIAEHDPQKLVAVISKKEQKLRTLPTVRMECPKCGNKLAYAWQVQTRGADESSTQFFRCTRCAHTFREYS